MRLLLSGILLLAASAVSAQNANFEQILVPFDTQTLETASGRWRSELWVRNTGATPVNIWASDCFLNGEVAACSRRLDVPAGRTMLADGFEEDGSSPGVLLYVDRNRLQDLVFSLRVRDTNRGADDLGTQLPIVRETDMKRGRAELINVPLVLHGRTHLRIYTADTNAAFSVRVYTEPDGRLLAERQYAAGIPTEGLVPPELPLVIDASSVFRGWVADRVRVEIERTLPADAPFWPLLTITNSRNNHVTVMTSR